ncbi:MAG: penicillin-binding protein 2 [Candidatus Omnitrophota bacterium]
MDRIKIVSALIICMFAALALGLFNHIVLRGRAYRALSKKNSIRLISQAGSRGNILGRSGEIIAGSRLSYDVLLLPQDAGLETPALKELAAVLGIDFQILQRYYVNGYIAPSIPVVIAKNIDVKKAIAVAELKSEFLSILVRATPLRHYPYGKLAAHVLGYVNEIDRWRLTKLEDYGYKTKDIVGFGGVEEKYDYYLRQEEGGLSVEVDHRGKLVRTLGFRQPVNGKDLQLTLDLQLQKITEEKLYGRKGAVIIMHPGSGEILAMASSPDFNPALFVNKDSAAIREIIEDTDSVLTNRAISSAYPPGSIFKVIVAAAALELKKINLSRAFVCAGKVFIGRQEFRCWSIHGRQNLVKAIAHSCNIFFYGTGLLLGGQPIHDYALKFGLSRNTAFELPYEEPGFIPSPLWKRLNRFGRWYPGDTANMSIGQGEILATPLQMSRMIAVFANQGFLVNPYIVKSVAGNELNVNHKKAQSLSLNKDTISYIRRGLRDAVLDPNGTANILSTLKVNVAGKTGTAQAPPGAAHAWFVGFFPFNQPRYVICVFLERGAGGSAAAAVAKQIIDGMQSGGLV